MENMIFQLSPLREGRQDHEKPEHGVYYFNSRPYVSGDLKLLLRGADKIFQLSPLREGRLL